MEFGRRTQAGFLAAIRPDRPASPRRRIVRMALAGLILGFGSVAAGTGLVHASERGGLFDFFGQIFGAPRQVEYAPPRADRRPPRRYSSLPDARHVGAPRQRHFTPRPVPLVDMDRRSRHGRRKSPVLALQPAKGPQSVCVRTCDGYVFPLGARHSEKDVPLHQAACAAACPDAPTALYTMPWGKTELDQVVSLKGQPYLAAAWANVYRQKRVENCHCRTPGSVAAPLAIDHDPTLRVGDVVATKTSASVVTRLAQGSVELEDYRSTRSLSRRARRSVDLRVGALERDAAERAFRRTMRTVAAGSDRIRLAEANPAPAGHGSAAEGEPALTTPGFAPVRVVARSPFVY
ncbi:DUF2865 domain-containing protein [Methylobacterium thuringiense]|uniref:DUF2865 domain-containing protein n=1 Tax=Methylobacterium thuringiense TaxID=1003091 RepID=A0ABQ4TM30_9HYPH|nr:DUF2865 domain-containing protein [Methylobacterium thuringiense]GJE55667.1 hypothetical protein EKPJFOCH_2162 [Methylobacterium thuringiense]